MVATGNDLRTDVVRTLREAHRRGIANPIMVFVSVHSPHGRALFQAWRGHPMKPANSNNSANHCDVIVSDDLSKVCRLLREHAGKAGAYVADQVDACSPGQSIGWYVALNKDELVVAKFKPDATVWMPDPLKYDQVPAVATA